MNIGISELRVWVQDVIASTSVNDPNHEKLQTIAEMCDDISSHFVDDGK